MNWWYVDAIGILILSAVSVIIMRNLSNRFSSDSMMCYMISAIFTGFAALLYVCPRTQRIASLKGAWSSICALALISYVSWMLWGRAIHDAPNPGYVHAIVNANVIVTVAMCAVLFGDHVTWKSAIGCIVVVIGLALVATSLQ